MKKNLSDTRESCNEMMQQAKITQLQIEVNSWKRFLNFFRDENVFLKHRLSDILKNGFDRKLLEEVENFQTRFIKHDDLINLLKNDIAELDKLLLNEELSNARNDGKIGKNDGAIDKSVHHLRNNIVNFEKQFCELQLSFNSYMLENL